MANKATDVELTYQMARMLPSTDPTSIEYKEFKKTFGQDGSVIFIGIKTDQLFELDVFNHWYELTRELRDVNGVQEVVSITRLYSLKRNDSLRKFNFMPVIKSQPETQYELDSLKKEIYALPFYEGLLFNKESNSTLMGVTLEEEKLNSKQRGEIIDIIKDKVHNEFSRHHDIDVHYSGLPFIRTVTSQKIKSELKLFILLAMAIASLALLLFFRSFKAMFFPMLIVVISVIWVLGTVVLLGYKITILTGIIPPLLIIIGVENCIFLLNKYHHEYKTHGNKIKALSRVVQRVGNAIFLTNLTTATGFAAFIVTGNRLLTEFGIVASINIMVVFALSLILIPVFFSFLAPPQERHIRHLDNKNTVAMLNRVVHMVYNHRRIIYSVTGILLIAGVFGVTRLKTTGNIVDDIPKKDRLYQDLVFFEKEFKGILPLEITIDTKKKRGIMQLSTIRKIERLQDTLKTYPEFAQPLSIAELVKFSKQAFFRGNPDMYSLPNRHEKNFIMSYMPKLEGQQNRSILDNFVDSTLQKTRISAQMKNIGTTEIERIKNDLRPKIDSIFNPSKYDVKLTGTSVVFLKGTTYLVNNLLMSLALAIVVIALLMAALFTSIKMVGISLIPNILPLVLTAALMGYTGITIKPSTILIFSIALGISVDNAIHFLSRYRLQLRHTQFNIKESVIAALRETGFSMIYSSIVLFLGFAIFTLSTFGGIEAMGFLISFTLLVAVLCNLFVLPSLLLSLDKRITTKAFREPYLVIFDEVEDIDLEELEIEEGDTRGSA
ncbi:MAG: MMPL family transporter [Bacteroidales bacterium]|nr:MMPL family transporter [Bacteroidales bacterium]